jgi:hypothetical protein
LFQCTAFLIDHDSVPTANKIITTFGLLLSQGLKELKDDQVDIILWVVTKVLPCVTLFQWKPFAAKVGRFTKKTTVSDLAAVCWLVTFYATPKTAAEMKEDQKDQEETQYDAKRKGKRTYKAKVDTKKAIDDYINNKQLIQNMYKTASKKSVKKGEEDEDPIVVYDQNIAQIIAADAAKNMVVVEDDEEEGTAAAQPVAVPDKARVDAITWMDL